MGAPVPEIVIVLLAIVFALGATKKVKVPMITHKTATLALVVTLVAGVYWFNWGGVRTLAEDAGVDIAGEPVTMPGVTFMADGSEAETYSLTYDQATQVFTALVYENVADHALYTVAAGATSGGEAVTDVTFAINVIRTDSITLDENAMTTITATVPTFTGDDENSGISYQAIDKDSTTERYDVAFTPAGVSARDEKNWFSVGAGGQRNIAIVADLDVPGIRNMDVGASTDINISIDGLARDFILRIVKAGEA